LKGANIGNDSVVATKAVVTSGTYENNVVLAGNPAKVVKRNIAWDISLLP
jgi:acetyltransferase-like isoleucine patch superfamily enzyme